MTPGFLVIGGAGFIGSHLVERLLERGPVTVFDDLSSGRAENLRGALATGRCDLRIGSVLDEAALEVVMAGKLAVFHLSANPDARRGVAEPALDLEQGTFATHAVLESMRRNGVRGLVFASSGTVYGDVPGPCSEADLGVLPCSPYGASKLASEALISAYVACHGLSAWMFRLGNVIGPRATHGAPYDFLHQLRRDPVRLTVLGDGNQAKPFVHVRDCVEGMLFGFDHAAEPLNVFNLAPPDATRIKRLAELCVRVSPNPAATIQYTGGERGWPGDVPRTRLDPGRLARLGYSLPRTSDQAVELAVPELAAEVFG